MVGTGMGTVNGPAAQAASGMVVVVGATDVALAAVPYRDPVSNHPLKPEDLPALRPICVASAAHKIAQSYLPMCWGPCKFKKSKWGARQMHEEAVLALPRSHKGTGLACVRNPSVPFEVLTPLYLPAQQALTNFLKEDESNHSHGVNNVECLCLQAGLPSLWLAVWVTAIKLGRRLLVVAAACGRVGETAMEWESQGILRTVYSCKELTTQTTGLCNPSR